MGSGIPSVGAVVPVGVVMGGGRRCSKADLMCEGTWESLERDWGREIIRGGRRRVSSSIARMAEGGIRVSSWDLCFRFRLWGLVYVEFGLLAAEGSRMWIFEFFVCIFFFVGLLNSIGILYMCTL